jgi:hypothetical protein
VRITRRCCGVATFRPFFVGKKMGKKSGKIARNGDEKFK